ncbi:hypothetical protein, partial [Aeromonas enteropelogenes]|uniref:hypothetical protein n=1 Tax=Aeromonas enteropelogenes TaxID=29489 RepID=UPI001C872DF6
SHGVCKRHKQVEYPGPTCQKAPSVAVTRGWGSHDLLADLGNNAALVHTLNNRLGDNRLDPAILTKVLDTYWAQFEERFQKIIADTPITEKPKARPEKDILSEILEHTRTLNSRLNRLEENQSVFFDDSATKNIRSTFELKAYENTCVGLFKKGKSITDISQSLKVPPNRVLNTLVANGLIAPPIQPED